jgi:hypothetical protein
VPLSTLRTGRKRWSVKDRMLALALTIHEDGLCPGCGQPRDRSWNEDMEGEFKVFRATCQGCQALHLEQDGHGARRPAETLFVRDRTPAGYSPDPRMMPKFEVD